MVYAQPPLSDYLCGAPSLSPQSVGILRQLECSSPGRRRKLSKRDESRATAEILVATAEIRQRRRAHEEKFGPVEIEPPLGCDPALFDPPHTVAKTVRPLGKPLDILPRHYPHLPRHLFFQIISRLPYRRYWNDQWWKRVAKESG